ncbi:MAG: beta-aspartyl-peptidase [Clostridium baratii]|uniref:beta-aspartyl-peptidase n=1 Tax=Clostridium baratii TaxID=1561 RepID=UPI0006BFD28B|nr:beta-aspartyl-peptidase [Clostridium baratii]MBS6007395.1 beta-aspartyl-peptidase [Clostridium baratii]MDU1054750.1 beta-aspartyl-peptidase [Clostridium baratii]CUP68760.1 isoaspartyl dipeptidase [Clostridium baratii]
MIKVIKNIKVYSPEYMGIKDIVIVKDKIEGIYENIEIPNNFINIEIIDGKGKIAFPGFIDAHVHLTGGGGEGGFKTRTPELQLSTITKSGITTVVGCIGTDGVCRDMRGLVAKVKALKEEGITAYCLTGSYEVPVNTMTESIKGDIMLVDEVIGVGEIALSDNRSSQPRVDQFINLVAESRVGGLLANKSGIVNVHLGGGARRLNYLFEMLDESEIPATQLLPTHMCRTSELLEAGIEWTKRGGYIDLTTSSDPDHLEEGEVIASKALKYALDKEVPIEQITFTSDGNGSMPLFDESGKLKGLGICSVESLYREVKKSILEENIKIEDAIKVITSNIAHILKFKHKGKIERGMDADIVIVDDSNLNIDKVIAMGNIMVDGGEAKVLGTFEN